MHWIMRSHNRVFLEGLIKLVKRELYSFQSGTFCVLGDCDCIVMTNVIHTNSPLPTYYYMKLLVHEMPYPTTCWFLGETTEDFRLASRKFWQTVRQLMRRKQAVAQAVFSRGVELLTVTGDSVKRWKEHFIPFTPKTPSKKTPIKTYVILW